MKLIIDIDENTYEMIKEMQKRNGTEYMNELEEGVAKGTPLPQNATNGDVIKAMFPNCEICEHRVRTMSQGEIVVGYDVFLYTSRSNKSCMGFGIKIFFDIMWWNAPYETESEE